MADIQEITSEDGELILVGQVNREAWQKETYRDWFDYEYVSSKPTVLYKSGFLAFRELPIFERLWNKVSKKPDLMVFDGHGIVHPRRLGPRLCRPVVPEEA